MVFDEALRELAVGSGIAVLVTLVKTQGSTPREAGSRMTVRPDASIAGTVGGGRPEGEAIQAALKLLAEGKDGAWSPALPAPPKSLSLHVEMTGQEAVGADLICGGVADLWVQLVEDRSPFRQLKAGIDAGESLCLVSSLRESGFTLIRGAEGWPEGMNASAIQDCRSGGNPLLDEEQKLFYSLIQPPERLLILGGGHVGRAVAELAQRLSFAVQVADPRPEFSDPQRFPRGCLCTTTSFTQAIEAFPEGDRSYVVGVSPGHLGDLECVRALVRHHYRYVGIIGSRRKCGMIIQEVIAEGADPQLAKSFCMPIGLEIGALSPEEIAVSITAELIAFRHKAPILEWQDSSRRRQRDGNPA